MKEFGPDCWISGTPDVPDPIPDRLEYVDPSNPELGFRLKPPEGWKLSITDGLPIPIDDLEPED